MKPRLLITLFLLALSVSGCDAAASPIAPSPIAPSPTSSVSDEPAAAVAAVEEDTAEDEDIAAEQQAECVDGVQFLAPSFGTDARWGSYQGKLVRDTRDIIEFWETAYGQLAEESYPGVCAIIEYEPETAPYLQACGLDAEQAERNAFYCPAINAIMWDGPNFYQPLYDDLGDAAVTFITAHEFGHVAQVLSGTKPANTVNTELQADCYAGAYLNYMDQESRMSSDDVIEVIRIVWALGESPLNSTWQDRTHGTSPEREAVVQHGFIGGVNACIGIDFEKLITEIELPEPPPLPELPELP